MQIATSGCYTVADDASDSSAVASEGVQRVQEGHADDY